MLILAMNTYIYIYIHKNKQVLLTAYQNAKTEGKQLIIPISERLVNRQVKLYGHLVRANEDDLMKKVTMYQDRTRRKSPVQRVGRPRTKWHTVTRKHTTKQLMDKKCDPSQLGYSHERPSYHPSSSRQRFLENFDLISPLNNK